MNFNRPAAAISWPSIPGRLLSSTLVVAAALAAPATSWASLEGKVVGDRSPVAAAKVYAFDVASSSLEKVSTDKRGNFLFKKLPAGLYKVIAFKQGFAPTVELLMRRKPDVSQFLQIELKTESEGDTRQAEGYWAVRSRVPPDVLRDMGSSMFSSEMAPGSQFASLERFNAQLTADGGVEQLGGDHGEAQLTTAAFDLHGELGAHRIGVNGVYQQLQPLTVSSSDGQVKSVAVQLDSPGESHLRVATSSERLQGAPTNDAVPVGRDHYQMSWSGKAGAGRTNVSAFFTEENGFHQRNWVDHQMVAEASRSLNVEGSYQRELSSSTNLEAGVRYREHTGLESLGYAHGNEPDQTIGIFGSADTQIQPRVMVEYGLYSSLRGGSLSLTPRGGMVVDLGGSWKARTSFAGRVADEEDVVRPGARFNAASYSDPGTCLELGSACYEVFFERDLDNGEKFSVGAIHREYAEALQLYFSPDFFDRLESVFLVRGDVLPEFQVSLQRKVSPRILARLQSNIASGGGGVFYASDNAAYENEVRYLVTSLDTQFTKSSTGVFVAFHHIEQALTPRSEGHGNSTDMELQRLQLMLTQDLNVLADMASNWAVRVNMEVSRGATPYQLTSGDELRRKLTGGISVSF